MSGEAFLYLVGSIAVFAAGTAYVHEYPSKKYTHSCCGIGFVLLFWFMIVVVKLL